MVVADRVDIDSVMLGYLLNFPKFVHWPANTLPGEGTAFAFCVLTGESLAPFSEALEGKKILSRSISVLDARHVERLQECRLLFIGDSERLRVPAILSQVRDQPTLTVSTMDNFIDRGGMIGLLQADGHVKFEINLRAALAAGLPIDARMADLAIRVIQ